MDKLCKAYENSSVTFDLTKDGIHLEMLWVDSGFRRAGLGTTLLKEITDLADTLQMPVTLQARGDIPDHGLLEFYQKHGFYVTNADPVVNAMRRPAVSKPEPKPEAKQYALEDELQPQRAKIRERLMIDKLLGKFKETEVSITYAGSGDSGGIDVCSLDDPELNDFLFAVMWQLHAGYENNDGGGGTVTWDLVQDKITVDHGNYYTASEDTLAEF